jgi:hypothetical protein
MKIDTVGIDLEQTMDAHSRKVSYYGQPIGTLLFHDWKFKLEVYPIGPIDLHLATAILVKAKADPSIVYQKREDHRKIMTENAKSHLLGRGMVLDGLCDEEIVQLYMRLTD